jgi:hypothetical protein
MFATSVGIDSDIENLKQRAFATLDTIDALLSESSDNDEGEDPLRLLIQQILIGTEDRPGVLISALQAAFAADAQGENPIRTQLVEIVNQALLGDEDSPGVLPRLDKYDILLEKIEAELLELNAESKQLSRVVISLERDVKQLQLQVAQLDKRLLKIDDPINRPPKY